MSDTRSTSASVLSHIKRQAKSIKKRQGITHIQALDVAAIESGFQNFRHAQNQAGPPVNAHAFPVTLFGPWRDKDGLRGLETLTISLPKPWQEAIPRNRLAHSRYTHYFDVGSEPNMLASKRIHDSQDRARVVVCGAARTLLFAAATGLRESSGHSRAYPRERGHWWGNSNPERNHRHIPGQDHISVWFDPATKRYLIVDEPYGERADREQENRDRWCAYHGYSMVRPSWPGMYAPDIGSRFYLFSSDEKGIPLGPIVAALNALPPPVIATEWSGESKTFPKLEKQQPAPLAT
ncbi:hypothetical protein Q6A26_19030 [Xanthomonas euvesicatoria pv. eucalypti]|uniref:hypothetical protein n=1 Tax=Xanthomonas euvesicatoria TaxID=456327 RepID=UPI0026E3989C|nr:hypothetical protein [Xanthomonas euvesicatoria]MDO7931077.1 hypothetical protein [Xanthomonas euvesicatoria pv. eucalypti]MDO7938321.1 hypothetical protein [Xanthomonas euvesicatoria pv. eucalypti]MDO7940516.1 hypothetical protein [Xanthomonas euvesicatoria pv. eucalypti]MDO7945138.1 hypothetical protein [Xanthomonas euvesicatoria pv. eucalypti]MDO7954902.1 hypothetical protein [Xanthomonas euvesicatoria pv. eucalypti]